MAKKAKILDFRKIKIKNPLKRFWFWRCYTTKCNFYWWSKRKGIDWQKDYADTWNYPHRYVLSKVLEGLNWWSLTEIGCGAGANLINIIKCFKGKRPLNLAGLDPNKEAIETAQKLMKGVWLKWQRDERMIFLGDKSTDITLTDMTLIYVGPLRINHYMRELRRITRNFIVLHEFHEKNFFKRWYLRIRSGRHSYNYEKLLKKNQFYDISIIDMPQFENDTQGGKIIIAKV